MLKNVTDITSNDFGGGLNTVHNIFSLKPDQSPNMMDVKIDYDGSLVKRLGSIQQNLSILTGSGAGEWMVDSNGTLNAGLSAFYKLDEVSGDRFDNFAANTLFDNGNTPSNTGIRRLAADFNGSNQYLEAESPTSLQTGDIDFTLSAWIYLNSTGGEGTILGKRDYVTLNGIDPDASAIYHFEESAGTAVPAQDSSQYGNTLADSKGTSVFYDTGVFRVGSGSLYCSSGAMYISAMSNFNMGTGDFAVECFVRFEGIVTGAEQQVLSTRVTEGDNGFQLKKSNTDKFIFQGAGNWNLYSIDTAQADKWYHLAGTRSEGTVRFFVDGAIQDTSISSADFQSANPPFWVGVEDNSHVNWTRGWIDEIRLSNGVPRYVSDFTVSTAQFIGSSSANELEYWLKIDTDDIVSWNLSSSGLAFEGNVRATSFGALDTATWYNIVAWHNATENSMGLLVNNTFNGASYDGGVKAGSAPFVLGAISDGTNFFLDGRDDEVGFWLKTLSSQEITDLWAGGSGNIYNSSFPESTWGSFDFGASNIRWYTIAAGTGIYTSSDLGVNFTQIGSNQTPTFTNFERSKNDLIITNDAYDTPLKWGGSGGSVTSVLNESAPLAKLCVNHQGYTILLNTKTRKRAFYYEDDNLHSTAAWDDYFEFPTSNDDEITEAVPLRKNLYVSTRYKLYRVSYVGGNPDWSYTEVKNWGFVPRTAQKIFLKGIGEVIVGMSWDRKLRLFDGSDDRIISDPVETDNGMCEFALDKLSFAGSGLGLSHSIVNTNEQTYNLCCAVGAGTDQTTHLLNFDGRNLTFYPYQNQQWQTMVMTESANVRYLLAGDRSGNVHVLNSGNLDKGTTEINEYFESPFIFNKSPSAVTKNHRIDFYFNATSSGSMYYEERGDFSNSFKLHYDFVLDDTTSLIQHKESIDIPSTYNIYQYRLSSSANLADPWRLNRVDTFVAGKGIGSNP